MQGAAMPAAAVAGAAGATADYLRIADGADAVLIACAGSALALAEAFCGQWLVARVCEEALATASGWQRLAAMPVVAIDGVAAAADHAVDIDAAGIGWVRVTAPAPVRVRYTAGLAAAWETLPAPLAQGIVLLAAHLFEHRDGAAMPPAAVAALWRPYRRMRLGEGVRA